MYGIRQFSASTVQPTAVCSVRNCSENTNMYGIRPFTKIWEILIVSDPVQIWQIHY